MVGEESRTVGQGSYIFQTVDVFTDQVFGGNPLAVILDATGLEAATMAAIAREFGYSETTFVLPPADPAHTARVRIFTPAGEIPFAGHPNVGTAFALARDGGAFGRPLDDHVVFEEDAGLVPVEILRRDGIAVGARLTAPQRLVLGKAVPTAVAAAAGSLVPGDVRVLGHPPCVASVGLPFVIAEVTDADALARAAPDAAAALALLDYGAEALLLYSHVDDARVRARMFAPRLGVNEDAATGSAAAALVGLLTSLASPADCALALTIHQGEEIGRPSVLFADARKHDRLVTEVRVAGKCVAMMRGSLLLPRVP